MSDDFFSDFFDDYFAESDEHLTIVRRGLLTLETHLQNPPVPRSLLDELFRSFHTLKGLSGMVGVKEAEQLAHDMESYLRALREQQVNLSTEGMDALINGTKMLEQVIANCRTENPAPDITPIINQIFAILPDSDRTQTTTAKNTSSSRTIISNSNAPLKLKIEETNQLKAAIDNGLNVWRFEFTSAAELAERGINVNTVRERLQQLGQLIHSSPRVLPSGGIVFDFIIATTADETSFTEWENDGINWTAIELGEESLVADNIEHQHSNGQAATQVTVTSHTGSLATSNVVRVDLAKLDELMRMVGELVISRSRLEDNLARLDGVSAPQMRPLRETNLALERQLRELRDGVMRVRLVPIGEVFARMQFVVRDLARESQKQVILKLSGQETEIDKFVVERMMDPLLHLVRNSVSHGLETETERIKNGKPPAGKLALRASTAGEMVIIEIEDDGRGVDVEKVAKTARQSGLIGDDVVLDTSTVLDLICSPGFSTREQADLTSGRGVGMAVVKNTILELGGNLTLLTTPGAGTCFRIELPLTLAIADALIVSVAGQTYAIPQTSVREVIEIKPESITVLQNNEILSYRNNVLPLIRLAHVFKLNNEAVKGKQLSPDIAERSNIIVNNHHKSVYALVVGTGLDIVGLLVDRVLAQQEIVVRSLNDPLIQVMGISGATELGDGGVVLILDAGKLKGQTSKVKY